MRSYTLTLCAAMAVAMMSCNKTATATPSSSPAPESTPAAAPADTTPVTMAFVGDIMMGTTYPETPKGAYLPANDGADIFRDTKSVLSGADLAFGNLEGTLLDRGGTPKRCGDPSKCFAFRMPQRYARHLVDAGIDVVGIANNHINDFGPAGLDSTLSTLRANGLRFAGQKASCPTTSFEHQGRRIGYASFSPCRGSMSILDLDEMRRVVRQLKADNDLVVISFHGGAEGAAYSHVPHKTETAFGENRGNVEAFAHAAVDAGADIVYGHGPHVPRAIELYKDHLIMYSLGNFATPYRMGLAGATGYAPVIEATLNGDGTLREGRIHSFIQQKGQGPRTDAAGTVGRHIRSLTLSDFPSTPLTIADDGAFGPRR